MRKLLSLLVVFVFGATSLYASGAIGGSKPGTCDSYSWGCNPFSSCYNSAHPENQYYKFALGTPERNAAYASYKKCAADFVTKCMDSYGCDAKKYFPNLFE